MASIDIEGTTTIVCGSWLNRSIDFHNGTSFFCSWSNSLCELGTDEFIFRSPKVFTNKCAKRKVERVVLNALKIVRLRRLIFAPSAISLGIVFGAVTDAKQRPGFPADPPLRHLSHLRRPNEYPRWVLPPPIVRRPLVADSDSKSTVYR